MSRRSPRLKAQARDAADDESKAGNAGVSAFRSDGEVPMTLGKSIVRFSVVMAISTALTQGLAYAAAAATSTSLAGLRKCSCIAIAIQWVVFLHAGGLFGNAPTEKFYDIVGSITYMCTLILSIGIGGRGSWIALSARQQILSACVAIWCVRLGSFLFSRIRSEGGVDSRFVAIKKSKLRFLSAWTLQGVWVFVTALPVFALNTGVDSAPLGAADFVGLALWVTGFATEVIADAQKSAFRLDKKNKGQFICKGLWAVSRHPNYFGEILLWCGACVSACAGRLATSGSIPYAFLASPMFVYLLLNYVSGVPLLEAASDKKWGDKALYQEYKARTPVLVPFLGKRG